MTVERSLDRIVADTEHVRREHRDRTDAAETDRAEDGRGEFDALDRILDRVQQSDETPRPDGADEPEHRIKDQLSRRYENEIRGIERWAIAEVCARDDGRDDARHDDDGERSRCEVAEDDFAREEHPADRRVERCGNAGGGAACDQRAHDRSGRAYRPPEDGADRGTDLNDGSLATATSAETDGRRRCERFDGDDARTDRSPVQRDRSHHLGHAVATSFGREARRNPCGDRATRGHDRDERESVRDRCGERGNGAAEREAMLEIDEIAKGDGTEPAADPDHDGGGEQIGTLREHDPPEMQLETARTFAVPDARNRRRGSAHAGLYPDVPVTARCKRSYRRTRSKRVTLVV